MELIGTGRDSEVFAIDQDTVLRRSDVDAGFEVRLMRHLHGLGFPVPEVFDAVGGDVTMERLHGPTLVAEMVAQRISAADAADVLLGLHERLHLLDAPDWLPGAPRGIDLGDGRSRILHLDLHPLNVMLTERGPYLVDWTNAAAGPPDFDVAVSWAVMAGVDFGAFGFSPEVTAAVEGGMVVRLRRGLSAADLDRAVRYRLADPNVDEAEGLRLRRALEAESS